MARIAFIGAGSFGFTRELVKDILTFPLLKDSTLVLMDIDKERLEYIRQACQLMVDKGNYPARIVTTMDRAEALKGADAVLCTILAGGVNVWKHDILIPKKYGIDTNIGDTRSISGMFRALRTIPVMVGICRDIERHCPNAIFLNYTNPMAMLCRAMQKATHVKVTGLCHSVQGTAGMLADWIGAKRDEITYVCAGINHQAWYIEFKRNHKDAYPAIRRAVGKKAIYNKEIVRNEMFLALGYYVTESSGHSSEYNWWFRKRQDLIRKYCTKGTGWNPGKFGYIVDAYLRREKTWRRDIRHWLKKAQEKINLDRGHEYAANIINAYMGGEPYMFNGNVPNKNIITNLPADACVEVPVVANRRGFNSIHVGALPVQLAAMNHVSISVEEMTVQAALTGDPTLVYQAAIFDPLCAAVLGLREIKKLVQEMLIKNRAYLPQFKNMKIS
ncbi:MAG: alpha-galactosidase [Planctomycetes bacterium]|nr:alpha-galactosidase [Planctomycetota bacterium]